MSRLGFPLPRRACLVAFVALATIAAPPRSLHAQTTLATRAGGTIRGTVFDSTAGAPLADAQVLLVHATRTDLAPRSIAADVAGRWTADDLAPGRWMVTFLHRVADEYGVTPVPHDVVIAGAETTSLALALPTAERLRAATCGRAVPEDSVGVLVGSVRDEETGAWVAGAIVTLSWRIMEMRDGVRLATQRIPVTTGADGTFRFCGVPVEDPLSLRASLRPAAIGGATLRSGELFVTVAGRGITRVHVGVGRGADTTDVRGVARLTGVVADPQGRPREGARVLVLGTGQEVTTGDAGAFRFDSLPAGSWTIEARAIGMPPVRTSVLLAPGAPATARLVFPRYTPTLDMVVVYGRKSVDQQLVEDFLVRKARGLGRYLAPDEIARSNVNQVTQLLAGIPEVRVVVNPRAGGPPVLRGRGGCRANVFLNGLRVPQGEDELDWIVRPADVLALEVHDDINGVPAAFGSTNGCVVVGVWTKRSRK